MKNMTFKGMLKILINDFKRQHEQNMLSVVRELLKTQQELREIKEQLQTLQSKETITLSKDEPTPPLAIHLFVQYKGFFKKHCKIPWTMTIKELMVKLRQLAGIPHNYSIRLRVLSEDGSTTLCFLHRDLNQTLESYNHVLKPQMIVNIEDDDFHDLLQHKSLKRCKSALTPECGHSFEESDV